MKISHKLALGATTLGLLAATAVPTLAATPSGNTDQMDRRTSLIQALVQRFNLKQADLETFFEEQAQQRIQEHAAAAQTRLEEHLTTAVTQGSITEAQKAAILAKAKEAQAKHAEARKLSREECKKMMDAYRTELEAWLSQQGLDRSYLPLIMGKGPGGPGGPGMMGPQNDSNQGGQGQSQNAPNGMRRGPRFGGFGRGFGPGGGLQGGQNQNGQFNPSFVQ